MLLHVVCGMYNVLKECKLMSTRGNDGKIYRKSGSQNVILLLTGSEIDFFIMQLFILHYVYLRDSVLTSIYVQFQQCTWTS